VDGLTTSLAEKAQQSDLNTTNTNVSATNTRIDTLVINSGNANAEVSDAHVSTVKNQTFTTLRNRLEDIENNTFSSIKNLILNGGFESGLTSWTLNSGTNVATVETSIVKNGTKSMRHTATAGTIEYLQQITVPTGHIVYASAFAYIVSWTSGSPKFWVSDYASGSGNPVNALLDTTKIGTWQQLSVIKTTVDTGERIYFDTYVGSDVVYDCVVAIDLTATFGAGSEPSKQDMDSILTKYLNSYFDGTVNLFTANKMTMPIINAVNKSEKGIANGIATLDNNGALTQQQIPSNVNDTVNAVFAVSKNMFDPTQATANKSVSLSDGTLYDNTGYYASGYMPVTVGLKYVASGNQTKYYAWYNASKVFISSGSDLTNMVAPANAAFIRITIGPTDYSTYQFEQGNTQTQYMAYGTKVSKVGQSTTRFTNKKGNFLGDSITWGYSPVGDGSRLANPYPSLVANTLGLSVMRNYGVSGTTISGSSTQRFIDRYSSMDNDADLIFVLGGTNDWASQIPIGTISDSTSDTFYGGLNILVGGLLDKYPTQTIVLATPMHRQGDKTKTIDLNDYRNAVLAIGAKYGIAVLDLYATSGFYPDNTTNYNAICPDGRHPNDAGHVKLANRVSGFLTTV
jgi:lysophospholipase L1-like esterase